MRGEIGPSWEAEARIYVDRDHPGSRHGQDQVAMWPDIEEAYHVPLEAARALAQAARWLFDQATSHPLEHWVILNPGHGSP
ncbi:hypothetical protein [Actinomadura rudentiformis]|uniref:Uncharacterized protein n=1 Tax=Actinomadura rudentiformis TaxID=359158 RepID=A0A6H9YQL2_9ACTN|nr:hypothetical protein [Actinomadura rudentiformis]KAB2349717.1 hypothetical protein F8566_13280 [Actinomadura rudentiformis]